MNWPTVKLGEIIRANYGKALKAGDRDETGEFPVFGSSGKVGNHAATLTKEPTIIIGRKGSVGAITFAPNGGWTIDTAYYVEILDKGRVELRYLFWSLLSARLSDLTITTSIPGLNREALYRVEIPLPPLAEQQRIAARLDAADRLRALRRDAVAALDALTHSLFLEMFGDPAHNPMNWPMVKLVDACLDKGKYGSGASATEFEEGKPRYIRITDIEDLGRLKSAKMAANDLTEKDLETYKLRVGDVLFARSGATVGKTYKYEEHDGDCVYAGYLIRFRPDPEKLIADFLFSFTGTSHYKNWVSSKQRVVAQPNINAQQYGYDLEIPLPPLSLQREFAARLEQIETVRSRMEDSRVELDALFASLQSAAFE